MPATLRRAIGLFIHRGSGRGREPSSEASEVVGHGVVGTFVAQPFDLSKELGHVYAAFSPAMLEVAGIGGDRARLFPLSTLLFGKASAVQPGDNRALTQAHFMGYVFDAQAAVPQLDYSLVAIQTLSPLLGICPVPQPGCPDCG